jgi:rhamnosyltransferase
MIDRIAAIYTTYRPDAAFRDRVAPLAARCQAVIVVDNTPGGHDFGHCPELTLLQDGRNKGLGAALNQGIRQAREMGCDAVILFDQDSTPGPDFLQALADGLQSLGGQRCAVGPLMLDDSVLETSGLPEITPEVKARPVTCLATSGMLFPIGDLLPEDQFSEEFFLDFVDFDWCWRMGQKGWRLFKLGNVPMAHRLGLAQRSVLGMHYHVPAPYRHYFQFRDTLRLLTFRHVPLYSKVRLGALLPPKFLVYPFILDRGLERMTWMLKGIRDFLLRRWSVGAAAARLQGGQSAASRSVTPQHPH